MEIPDTRSAHAWVWILDTHHHVPHPSTHDPLDTRPRATGVTTRLQGAIQRGTVGRTAGLIERDDLSMRTARPRVEAATDDPVTPRQDGADHRVGTGRAAPSGRQRQRLVHYRVVDHLDISSSRSPGKAGGEFLSPCRLEQGLHILRRRERHQVVQLLADTDIANRHTQLGGDRDRDAAFRGAIQLRQHDPGHPH